MAANNLSPESIKEFIALRKKLQLFLKNFKDFKKGSEERSQYLSIAYDIQELNGFLKDLTGTAVEVTPKKEEQSQPKTKKEIKKTRREKRREARAEKRKERRAIREANKVTRKKQSNDKSGTKEEGQYRFDNIKATWEEFKFDEITTDFRSYLDQGEQFLEDADNFISYAKEFTGNFFEKEIEEVEELIKRTEKFINIARNVSKQVDRYVKIAQDVINITLTLPSKVENLKKGVIKEATKIFAAAKSFIATADIEDEELELKVGTLKRHLANGQKKLSKLENLVGLVIKDEDGDNLPDWYNRLEAKYNELLGSGTDLIPGTSIDDKILLQLTGLKKSVDKFIAAASDKVEALGLQEKLKNAQQWLGELSKFTEAITGFVENIEDGDLLAIYEDLKSFKDFIDSDKDILQGTNLDDTIKNQLQKYSKNAQTWLMNRIAGGDPDKEKEVRSILGSIDKIILSTGGVPDHASKYENDQDKISIPEINDVSQSDIDEALKRHGIHKKDSSYEGILSDMKSESTITRSKVTAKFVAAVTRGSDASALFRDAKDEYDKAVKKHNDYFRATNSLGKKIINGLLSVAGVAMNSFAPGSGKVIETIGDALLGDFNAINSEIDKIIPDDLEFIGDLTKDIIPGILPKWGDKRGVIKIEGKELLKGLNQLYVNGVSVRYKEVLSLLSKMEAKTSNLGKNLRSMEQLEDVDQSELSKIKKKVIILEMKWTGLKNDIMKKYVDLTYPPIKRDKAYRYASRYLYSEWLIRFPKKEIRIANVMIEQFEKYGIMKESKAKWKTGFWAGLGRGFFGFFRSDPFNYRAELGKMKTWAFKENDALKSAKAWARVL